jgi:hypothetical protein
MVVHNSRDFSGGHTSGQSILEVLVATAVGAIFIVGAATIIAPSLLISKQSGLAQTKTELATELLSNAKTWAAGNWDGLLQLATSSANTYYLNTSSSPFTVTTGTQAVFIGAVSSTRYFYLSDVYRDSSGNVTSTTSGNSYDPSTKQITVTVNGTRNGAPTSTIVAYFTRNGSNVFDQTDWSGGPGLSGPVVVTGNQFAASTNMNYSGTAGSLLAMASASSSGGWPNGYTYRRTITATSNLVAPSGTTLTNFPMLISGNYSYLATVANGGNVQNANGYDVIFTSDASGTNKLSFEQESYSSSTGAVNYWVKVPTLSSSSNVIYMFYGDSGISSDQSNASGTWDANYTAVYHFAPSGGSPSMKDSTANANLATNVGAGTTSGQVGNAISLNGSSQYVDVPDSTSIMQMGDSPATVSAWVYGNAALSYTQLFYKDAVAGIALSNSGNGYEFWGSNNGGLPAAISSDAWHYITMDIGLGGDLYIDGIDQVNFWHGNDATSSNDLTIGYDGGSDYWPGDIDEFRISNVARSQDWIVTEYNNQLNPGSFYTVGSAAIYGGGISSGSGLHWAWNDDMGWIDFYNGGSVSVNSAGMTGYASSSEGDVSLDCATTRNGNICSGSGGTYSNGYAHRRAITVATSLIAPSGTTLSNFPMLISGTYSYLAASSSGGNVQNGNGYDIIFTSDASGTSPLPYERESYNSSTGAVNYWVKVPTLSSSSNVIYMFYGNSGVSSDQSNATGTWDSNYVGVWHLADNAANTTVKDSTGNSNTGTSAANTSGKTTSGQFGSALTFNGSTDYIYTANSFSDPQDETVQIWFKTSSTAGAKLIGFEDAQSGTGGSEYDRMLWVGTDGKLYGGFFPADYSGSLLSASTYDDNNWHLADLVYDGVAQQDRLYVDGQQVGSTISDTDGPQNYTGYYRIGSYKNGWTAGADGYFSGSLQEARVSSIARSSDWIATEYNNQSNPSAFYSVGSDTPGGGNSWSNGYSYRRTITVASNLVAPSGTTLTDFPVLISGTYSYLATSGHGGGVQNSNGYDVIFSSDAAGTSLLNYDRESYSSSTGAVNYWIKTPTLSSSSNVIYMFYGNSGVSTDQSNATGTWNSNNYLSVYHLPDGTTLTANDSTVNGHNGSISGGATAVTGEIGGGASFDGSSGYVDMSNFADNLSNFTVSAWFDTSSTSAGPHSCGTFIVSKLGPGGCTSGEGWGIGLLTPPYNIFGFLQTDGSDYNETYTNASFNDGNWHQVNMVVTGGSTITLYIDGSPVSQSTANGGTLGAYSNTSNVRIANDNDSEFFSGREDEVQISNVARSSDWIATEYNNQSNPSAFYTIGSATTNSGGGGVGGQYQVLNDGAGNLSGWAWNDEFGWISFCGGQNSASCPGSTVYETTIDSGGNFQGWAWNDVVGWIDFNCDNNSSCGSSNYEVQTSWTSSSATSTVATLDSPTFDTGVPGGAQFNSIGWQGGASVGSSVQFQLAVSNSSSGPWNFKGTDGTSNTYYTPSAPGTPVSLNYSTFSGFRYFRYRVAITYGSATSSRVDDVIVNWSP